MRDDAAARVTSRAPAPCAPSGIAERGSGGAGDSSAEGCGCVSGLVRASATRPLMVEAR